MKKKEMEDQYLQERNHMLKQSIKEGIMEGKQKHFTKVKEDAEILKEQK